MVLPAAGCAVMETLGQAAKLLGVVAIFAAAFAEAWELTRGRPWRRAKAFGLCMMAAGGGFLGALLL